MGFFDGMGSGLLSGLGSIFAGGIAAKAQEKTNQMNLQIARETNEANRKNQEYQNNWNLNMWNAQNEYNDPSAQRERLEKAGLNPMFFGLDGTGNAASLQSAPFTATTGAPMENSGQFMAQGIMNAMNTLADIGLKKAQIRNIDEDTNNKIEDTKGKSLANEITEATKETTIEGAAVSLEINKGVLDMQPAQKNLLGKYAEQVDANIIHMREDTRIRDGLLKLQQDTFDFTKDTVAWEQAFKRENFDFEQKKFAQEMALNWFRASLEERTVKMTELITPSMAKYYNSLSANQKRDLFEKIKTWTARQMYINGTPRYQDAQIKLINGQAKLVDKEGNLIDQKTEELRYYNSDMQRAWRMYNDFVNMTNGAMSAVGSIIPF